MKKTITLFTVLLAFCAAAGNTLLLDMESVASITSKGGKFHGGEFGEGPRVAEAISGEILAIPIYPESTTEMREYVVNTIKEFFA